MQFCIRKYSSAAQRDKLVAGGAQGPCVIIPQSADVTISPQPSLARHHPSCGRQPPHQSHVSVGGALQSVPLVALMTWSC